MSTTMTPAKGHRHTRSAALPPPGISSHNPQNPHHLNSQSQAQSEIDSPQPSTPPRTPRRNNQTQPPSHKATPSAPETGSKKKPRNNRPKNVNTSPALTRNGRPSPPLAGSQTAGLPSSTKPIPTPSTAAYAGPTFHASPAPSALPIPSFYSKSVPDSPSLRNLKMMKATAQSPKPALSNCTVQREESPLDLFFRADREEKARARSANSTQIPAASTGPFQPPFVSPQSRQTPPVAASQSGARHSGNRNTSGGIFAMELDGESSPGLPFGPAFSTPYSERINAARAAGSEPSFRDVNPSPSSEALKAYLFSGHQLLSPAITPSSEGPPSPFTPTAPAAYRNPASPAGLRSTGPPSRTQSYGTASVRSSGLRQEVTPTKTPDRNINYAASPTPVRRYANTLDTNKNTGTSTPQATSPLPARSADIQGMEDSLRRILKLGPAGSPGPINGNLPVATQSVPTYVGRPPPMNGVMGS